MRGLKGDVVMSEAKIAAVTGGACLISSDFFAGYSLWASGWILLENYFTGMTSAYV